MPRGRNVPRNGNKLFLRERKCRGGDGLCLVKERAKGWNMSEWGRVPGDEHGGGAGCARGWSVLSLASD